MQNYDSLIYQPDLNKIGSPRGAEFLARRTNEKVSSILEGVVDEVSSEDSSGINLRAFFSAVDLVQEPIIIGEGITLIVFPKRGSISYELRKDRHFLSNTHQGGRSIYVTSIAQGIPLSTKSTNSVVWLGGRRHNFIPNYVNGVLLCKTDPFEHKNDYPELSGIFEEDS